MKILFLARRFHPLLGGVEKHCLLLGKELLKRGHQLTIVTEWDYEEINNEYTGEPPKFIAQEEYEGIKIIRIPVATSQRLKKWQIWFWFLNHQKLFRDKDVIHCHDVFYWFLPFRYVYPRKKVFVTFHGYEGNQPPNWRKRLAHQMADRLSQGNICIGDFQAKWYGVKPTYVSYGAVGDEIREIGEIRVRGEKGKQQYDLCYVGRLAEDVGITVYLEALKILKEKGINLSLAVCGDGPLMQASKRFVQQEGLKVEFYGFIKNPLPILRQSKVALISRYLGILEALAMAKPIVAVYDNQIKKDYLFMAPYAKWISVVGKPKEVASAIERAIKVKEGGDRREDGRLWAKAQSWSKMTNLYTELWQHKLA